MMLLISILGLFLSYSKMILGIDGSICTILFDKYDKDPNNLRNFLSNSNNRWPSGRIPFRIHFNFSIHQRSLIGNAMKHIEDNSCVRFVPDDEENDSWLSIITGGSGCYSNLGYHPRRDEHILHLSQSENYCMKHGTIVHELLHILGFAHEHTRPDRDQYISVNWKNIPIRIRSNWFRASGMSEDPIRPCVANDTAHLNNCSSEFRVNTFGIDYDYGSIMHYGPRAGSRYGRVVLRPLKPLNDGTSMGQRKALSYLDIRKLNAAYPCS